MHGCAPTQLLTETGASLGTEGTASPHTPQQGRNPNSACNTDAPGRRRLPRGVAPLYRGALRSVLHWRDTTPLAPGLGWGPCSPALHREVRQEVGPDTWPGEVSYAELCYQWDPLIKHPRASSDCDVLCRDHTAAGHGSQRRAACADDAAAAVDAHLGASRSFLAPPPPSKRRSAPSLTPAQPPTLPPAPVLAA